MGCSGDSCGRCGSSCYRLYGALHSWHFLQQCDEIIFTKIFLPASREARRTTPVGTPMAVVDPVTGVGEGFEILAVLFVPFAAAPFASTLQSQESSPQYRHLTIQPITIRCLIWQFSGLLFLWSWCLHYSGDLLHGKRHISGSVSLLKGVQLQLLVDIKLVLVQAERAVIISCTLQHS